jgi:hypothetical protein
MIVELKALTAMVKIHRAQCINYSAGDNLADPWQEKM